MNESWPGRVSWLCGRDDGVGDAVEPRDRNQFRLGMEGVVHMHVRHDLVAGLDQIVGAVLGGNLGEAEVAFRIDQPGIDRHAGDVDDLRVLRDLRPKPAAPTAVILPPCITSTPFSIAPCETVSSLPPLSTRVFCWAKLPLSAEANRQDKEQFGQRPTTNGQRPSLTTDDLTT